MKIVQLVASNNDLYALSDEGEVFYLVGVVGQDLKWIALPKPPEVAKVSFNLAEEDA